MVLYVLFYLSGEVKSRTLATGKSHISAATGKDNLGISHQISTEKPKRDATQKKGKRLNESRSARMSDFKSTAEDVVPV